MKRRSTCDGSPGRRYAYDSPPRRPTRVARRNSGDWYCASGLLYAKHRVFSHGGRWNQSGGITCEGSLTTR